MLNIKSIIQLLVLKARDYNDRKEAKRKTVKIFQQIIDDGNNISLARFYNVKGERIRGKYEGLKKRENTNSNLHPLEAYYKNK